MDNDVKRDHDDSAETIVKALRATFREEAYELLTDFKKLLHRTGYKSATDLEGIQPKKSQIPQVIKSKKRVGDFLIETGIISSTKAKSALIEQQHVREMREQRLDADSSSKTDTIRGERGGACGYAGVVRHECMNIRFMTL